MKKNFCFFQIIPGKIQGAFIKSVVRLNGPSIQHSLLIDVKTGNIYDRKYGMQNKNKSKTKKKF